MVKHWYQIQFKWAGVEGASTSPKTQGSIYRLKGASSKDTPKAEQTRASSHQDGGDGISKNFALETGNRDGRVGRGWIIDGNRKGARGALCKELCTEIGKLIYCSRVLWKPVFQFLLHIPQIDGYEIQRWEWELKCFLWYLERLRHVFKDVWVYIHKPFMLNHRMENWYVLMLKTLKRE